MGRGLFMHHRRCVGSIEFGPMRLPGLLDQIVLDARCSIAWSVFFGRSAFRSSSIPSFALQRAKRRFWQPTQPN